MSCGLRALSTSGKVTLGPIGFVFDIDGVLIRGGNVLPQALRAMKGIYDADGQTPRVPLAFLTNGGGMTEALKANELSEQLGVRVLPKQVVLSHTPFQQAASQLADEPVLVVGRGDVVHVARTYGLKKIVSTRQLAQAFPTAVPFWPHKHQWMDSSSNLYSPKPRYGTESEPIRAIAVFSDPADWYLDLQLVCDVLVGGGVMGRKAADVSPENDPPVQIYFSNPDLLWANEFPLPRFGQGAFAACLETLYSNLTGGDSLPHKTVYGKPNPAPYSLIERVLGEQARALGLLESPIHNNDADMMDDKAHFAAIYAIGDNSAADVRGANARGSPWVSVLVRTGVFNGPGCNCQVDPAHIVVDDVEAAIEAASHHARSMRWHSMR